MPINSLQKQRIELILAEDMPSSYDSQTEASVWDQWKPRFNVTFFQYDTEVYQVVDESGHELSNGELNKALTSIIEAIQRSKNHVEHVRSTDKIKSITTSSDNPRPGSLDKYIKQLDPKTSLDALKNLYNQASQEMEVELASKSAEEQLAHVQYLEFRATLAREIYNRLHAKHETKIRIKINEVRTSAKTKRDKKQPRLSKPEVRLIEKSLSPAQVMMKASGRKDYMDLEAVKAYEKNYFEMMGESIPEPKKYDITKTESTTQQFKKAAPRQGEK